MCLRQRDDPQLTDLPNLTASSQVSRKLLQTKGRLTSFGFKSAFFADFVTDHSTGRCAAYGAECAAENRVPRDAAENSTGRSADLRIGGAGATTSERSHCDNRSR